jgi:hypothetical protein
MDDGQLGLGIRDWEGWWRGWLQSFEGEAATGMERLVAGEGFAELLVRVAENAAALSKLNADFWDLVLRNLRLVGRADIERLARQMTSTEDKLERLLQAVEPIQDERVGR